MASDKWNNPFYIWHSWSPRVHQKKTKTTMESDDKSDDLYFKQSSKVVNIITEALFIMLCQVPLRRKFWSCWFLTLLLLQHASASHHHNIHDQALFKPLLCASPPQLWSKRKTSQRETVGSQISVFSFPIIQTETTKMFLAGKIYFAANTEIHLQ